ncbi:MAG: hypothetical protein ACNI25_12195 [Halarcobacter sp.]
MKNNFTFFIFRYGGYLLLILLALGYFFYFGIYAYFGNKVISKTDGMIILSESSAITNILFGFGFFLYICYLIYKKFLK